VHTVGMGTTTKPAERLVNELGRLGYAARAIEHGLAVRIQVPAWQGERSVDVWMPDTKLDDEYIWITRDRERTSEHKVPADVRGMTIARAASLIVDTLPQSSSMMAQMVGSIA
jgi:hypothetical protein